MKIKIDDTYHMWYDEFIKGKRGMDMAKKQITPEEYKAKLEKKEIKNKHFSQAFFKSLAIFLSCVIVFSIVSISQTLMLSVGRGTQNTAPVVDKKAEDPTADWGDGVITNDSTGETEDGQKKPYSTVSEVVDLFNTSMNRVKKEAVKVTKNYEKRTVNQLELPSALQSMGDTLINEVMKDDTEPIVYATKQEIRDNFMVPNQDYVSCLKAEDVEKVAFKDNGSEYEIYILVKDEKSPTAGSGVGSTFDVIEANEMAEKAPSFLKEFTTEYYNCVVKVKIDKQSGRVTHANYSTPLYMYATVEMLGVHNVVFGVTFEKDYTIEY